MHVMRVETHAATAVSHQQFGVVVLLLGNKSQRIDKRHRLEKVVEAVGLFDGHVSAIAMQFPAFPFGPVCYDLCSCQRSADGGWWHFLFQILGHVRFLQGSACGPGARKRAGASSKTSRTPDRV